MAENSEISWTDHTANFWIGCKKVSPLCDNCYAERDTTRWGKKFLEDRNEVKGIWDNIERWEREAARTGVRKRVFVMSLGDFFEDLKPDHKDYEFVEAARQRAFKLMERTTHLDYLVLTKRVSNIHKMVPRHWLEDFGTPHGPRCLSWPSHIRAGISVGTQPDADRDIQRLLKLGCPNFLSMEPLLEHVVLKDCLSLNRLCWHKWTLSGSIDWVITGGESGPPARPASVQWYRDLRDQCIATRTPFHFKQWGEWLGGLTPQGVAGLTVLWGKKETVCYPDGSFSMKIGRKAAGHLLDGVEWYQFPEGAANANATA